MNIPDRLKELYSRLTGSRKAMTAAAAVGIAGMLMILFSEVMKMKNQRKPSSPNLQQTFGQTTARTPNGGLKSFFPP